MNKNLILVLFCTFASVLNAQDKNGVFLESQVDKLPSKENIFDWITTNQRPTCGPNENVVVKFIVLEDGTISNPEVLKSKSTERSNEAMRLMKAMPKWDPAIKKGKPVKCYYMMPFFLSSLTVTDNGNVIVGKYACSDTEHTEWTLNKRTQTLSISGSGKIHKHPMWNSVHNIILASDVDDYTFIKLCSNVRSITVSSSNVNYVSIDGVLYNKAKDTLLAYPKGRRRQNFSIPIGVKTIDEQVQTIIPAGVFKYEVFDDVQIDTLFIPSSIKNIPPLAFNKTSIKSFSVSKASENYTAIDGVLINKVQKTLLSFPKSVKRQNFSIPVGVETIADSAFNGTLIDTLIISSTVKEIPMSAFQKAHIGCFMVKDNPNYTIHYNILWDSKNTPYYSKNLTEKLLDSAEGIPFISASQFNEKVMEIPTNSTQKCIYKNNKPSVFIITTTESWCKPCWRCSMELKLLYEKYKEKVDFYQIESNDQENAAIKHFLSASKIPSLYAFNGIQLGEITYASYNQGNDIKWLTDRIEEMLAGKRNR